MQKIAINGLGRIGRCVIRALVESGRKDIELVAANGPASIEDHAHLLKYDSVHGTFKADVKIEGEYLVVNQHKIKITSTKDINQLNWAGIDTVLECSGKFNNKQEAGLHLTKGASKVLVSAPCDGADVTVVYGVNNQAYKKEHQVISIGSCTTNALAPIAKILNDSVGIEYGFMTTIHSYTNDQNLLDGSHKDRRRMRACALSMVPTSTGAAKALGLVLPELEGKLSGSAVRVPTPNVSLVDLCFVAKNATSKEAINDIVKAKANGDMKNIVEFVTEKLVSIDFNHNSHSSSFDPFETNVTGGKFVRVVSWYDNEWGFSNRMLDVLGIL